MKAVRIHSFGGPEVLRFEDVPVPEPGDNQALVRVMAAGVNFVDVYQRSGFYKVPLPYTGRNGSRRRRGKNRTRVRSGARYARGVGHGAGRKRGVCRSSVGPASSDSRPYWV